MNEKQARSSAGEARQGQKENAHGRGASSEGGADGESSKETLAREVRLPTNPKFSDLTGLVFGRFTVINFTGFRSGSSTWNCRCECGKIVNVFGGNLRRGLSKSCGCLRDEVAGKSSITHGKTQTVEYGIWEGLRNRCQNPKHRVYRHYGGRGIAVCARWNDFTNFIADMGPRPSKGHSIDRFPNNDGNYEPGNCRWATASQQSDNRRNSRPIEHNGETLTIAGWEKRLNFGQHTIWKRLKRGWSIEKALSKLPRNHTTEQP